MGKVRAKKHLGQHFLADNAIAKRIVESLIHCNNVLEIGSGMGVLTKFLLEKPDINLKVVEIDKESVAYLTEHFPHLFIYDEDFLKLDIDNVFSGEMSLIGNFPYNISNQILFKVFSNKEKVIEVIGMFQKEVAERITAKEGSKTYGILSVLLSAYYDLEYLFSVNENVFLPPPKVKSAVIRMRRNAVKTLPCDENFFVKLVKTAFNQRRKMLRTSLKPLNLNLNVLDEYLLTRRPEQLSVEQFIEITKKLNPL